MASTHSVNVAVGFLTAFLGILVAFLSLVPGDSFLSRLYTSIPVVVDSKHDISYRGLAANDVEQFHNIFYAQDTSGSNRFAPPVPFAAPRGTVIDATSPGAYCPQGLGGPPLPFASPVTSVSENCLSLRIARPRKTNASSKLPVVVWIHGGEFLSEDGHSE